MAELRRVSSLLILTFLLSGVVAAQSRRPNIIFMMSDDHAYQAISAYGHGLNQTPQIDRLAASGMLFTRAFVSNSICGPSRAVFLTGKHSHKNGFKDNHSRFNGDQQTVVKLLKQAGYQTAITGKWHLVSDPQGFDYWNILPDQGKSQAKRSSLAGTLGRHDANLAKPASCRRSSHRKNLMTTSVRKVFPSIVLAIGSYKIIGGASATIYK